MTEKFCGTPTTKIEVKLPYFWYKMKDLILCRAGDGMPFAIDGLRSHFTMLLFLYEEMRYLLVSGAGKDTLG